MLSQVGTALVIALAVLTGSTPGGDVDTGGAEQWLNDVTNNGASVDVSGSLTQRASDHDSMHSSPDRPRAWVSAPEGGQMEAAPPPPATNPRVAVDCVDPTTPCELGPLPPPPAAPAGWTVPAVTLSDLASFRPTPPTLTVEPDGVGVAGLPVNLVAGGPAQTLRGTLFDHPVAVTFTPHHYVFAHGDGTTATGTRAGSTWASAREAQFTPTETSHIYRDRGVYSVSVAVSYTPTVRFDVGGPQTVPGFVTATSAAHRVRVYEAHTALVARTCVEDPTGPGC